MNDFWFVYIVRCTDGTLYVGIAKNLQERVVVHNAGRGAKYTAARRPVTVIWTEKHVSQISAMRREIQIKKWRREKKEALIRKSSKNF